MFFDLVNFLGFLGVGEVGEVEACQKIPSTPHQLSSVQVWVPGLVSGPLGGLRRWTEVGVGPEALC